MLGLVSRVALGLLLAVLVGCDDKPGNQPFVGDQAKEKFIFASFAEQPRTLDPSVAYSTDEAVFVNAIVEPPLTYDYLKRPYQLLPQTLTQMPQVIYLDKDKHVLPNPPPYHQVAETDYIFTLKPGILYAPHPSFAKDHQGRYLYHDITPASLENIEEMGDFKESGTRELISEDYVYAIKRLADPQIASPIFGLMSEHIIGMKELNAELAADYARQPEITKRFDLRKYSVSGVQVIDRYHWVIKTRGIYPQFLFWLSMPFFAAMPWEADYFDSQPGMADKNLTLNWYPVGTGPFMLTRNDPNRQMRLERNPNYRERYFPNITTPADAALAVLSGHRLPLVDGVIFNIEKEVLPRWNKFLQGYYDSSSVSNDAFSEAISFSKTGEPEVSATLKEQGIQLRSYVSTALFYIGFNMQDATVGGLSDSKRALRQALSIALNSEEYIRVFLNGRGEPAMSPLPPGIAGALSASINPYTYRRVGDVWQRRSLDEAKALLTKAGYPEGIDPKTGQALVVHLDVTADAGPEDAIHLAWMRRVFADIGVDLNIRATTGNRFQEKLRTGAVQLYMLGWFADYPDAENFLFLLYGPYSKMKSGGENSSNYQNPEFDRLFARMRVLPDGQERNTIIARMVSLVQQDAPWIFWYYPRNLALLHAWVGPTKPSDVIRDTLKYQSIDPKERAHLQQQWNKPSRWPLIIFGLFVLLTGGSLWWLYRHRQQRRIDRFKEGV